MRIPYVKFVLVLLVTAFAACKGSETAAIPGNLTKEKRQQLILTQAYHNAVKQRILGNPEEAIKGFEYCLKLDQNHAASHYELARLFKNEGEGQKAIAHAQQASDLGGTHWYHVLHGQLLGESGQYSAAADALALAIKMVPDQRSFYEDRMVMYMRGGDVNKALKAALDVRDNFGLDAQIARALLDLYFAMNKPKEAVAVLEDLIRKDPSITEPYAMLAEVYERTGELEKVFEVYRRLLKVDPRNPYAHLYIADHYYNSGKMDSFERYSRKAFENPRLDIDAKVGYLVGMVTRLRDPSVRAAASNLAQLTTKIHPAEAKAFAVYGDILAQVDSNAKALIQYDHAIELDNSVFAVWQQKMFILADMQAFEELAEVCREAVTYYPNQTLPWYLEGFAESNLGNYSRALSPLKRAELLSSGNIPLRSDIFGAMGDAYYHLGRFHESDSCYDEALRLRPQSMYTLNNYAYYLSLRGEKLDKALEMAELATTLDPTNSAFMDTRGWILYQMKRFDQALVWIGKALANSSRPSGEVLEHYGDTLFQLGRIDEAVDYWKKAAEKGGHSDELQQKIREKKLHEK